MKDKFNLLPLGSVKPKGWLHNQLKLQRDNITIAMETYPDYSANSAWLGGTGEDWERGPYYVRGLVALAYTLDDEELKKRAQKWIDWTLDNQREDGYFGPASNNDWWPRMPMLMAIRDYYEVTEKEGNPDKRVIPFMTKYFRYQLKELPNNPLTSWAHARGGDNIDSVYWLYNKLYDENNPENTDWLLDLATLLKEQTEDWTNIFNNTTVRHHVVNTSQALKMPVLYYKQSKSEEHKEAFKNALFNFNIDHGRIDGLPNSDEAARDNKSTRGTETCSVVESMLSTEIAIRVLGDISLGCYLERMAYNSLPASYSPDYKGHVYYTLQNQVCATNGYHEFDCDHGDSCAFGAPNGFDCCFSNNHMGWPKFVQNMWLGTPDGLAIAAYGPNTVSAKVAGGKNAVFTQETNYPFSEDITLTYQGDKATFPLLLRIPSWCKNPVINVNGNILNVSNQDGFCVIDREWSSNDKVKITFPMEIKTSTWYNNSVAVERGPLIYSLKIKEDWRLLENNDTRELKVGVSGGLLNREVYPQSKWNYGLIVDENNVEGSFEVLTKPLTNQPFSSETAPIVLKAKGQVIPEWILDGNIAASVPYGYTPYNEALIEDIELIPYGSARLKITHFPRICDPNTPIVRNDVIVSSKNDVIIQELKNIVVPHASNYDLKVNYEGSGVLNFVLNGKNIREVSFADDGNCLILNSLESLIEDEHFKFDAAHYNNLRFIGTDDVVIKSIEVMPKGTIEKPVIESITSKDNSVTIKTNINRDIAPFKIIFCKAGDDVGLNYTASGFKTNTAVITGLEPGEYCFKAVAFINGAEVSSEEAKVIVDDSSNADTVNSSESFVISGTHAFEMIQIKFPKIVGATSFKISYGTKPGEYTNFIYDVIFNPYKSSDPYTADKISFTVENDEKYYVKLTALKDDIEMMSSNEIEVLVISGEKLS